MTKGCSGSFISPIMLRIHGLQSGAPSGAPRQRCTSDCVACLPVIRWPKKQVTCVVFAATKLCKDAVKVSRAGAVHLTGITPLGILRIVFIPKVRQAAFMSVFSEGRVVRLTPLATCRLAAISFSTSLRLFHKGLLLMPGSHIPVMSLAHLTRLGVKAFLKLTLFAPPLM